MKFGELEVFNTIMNIIKKYYNGRPLTVIGNKMEIVDFLRENGFEIKNIFSTIEVNDDTSDDEQDIGAGTDSAPAVIPGIPDPDSYIMENEIDPFENYVLFTDARRKQIICDELEIVGFTEFQDYVFVNHGKIVIRKGSPDYHDEYGNNVHCSGCKVYIQEMACNVNINVDDSARFDDKCFISAKHLGGCEITIGAGCRFVDNVSLVAAGNSTLRIGNGTKIVMNSGIVVLEGNSVTLGENCLLSYDVKIYSGDGHAVYNTGTRERINPPLPTPRNVISIGDHVWIGMRAVILNRCSIGSGSIVGAGAIVKGTFPNNCVINGNPAKITAKNIAWSNGYKDDDLDDIPEEYFRLTEEK